MKYDNSTPESRLKVVDSRTTGKDKNKNQTTNIIYDQNSMSIMKNHNKIKLSSEKNQNKTI